LTRRIEEREMNTPDAPPSLLTRYAPTSARRTVLA
jgi:hypothetical protein